MLYNHINFNLQTVLITGGAGFIGSNIAFYLQEHFPDCHIVIFDCFRSEATFSNGNLESFGHYKNLIGFQGNIICGNLNCDEDLKRLETYQFDYIFHQAAISDTRVYDQEIIMKTNVNSFYFILNLAKRNKSTVVYASSAATYGSMHSPQTVGKEKPENPYGFSKYAMDKIAYSYMKENPSMNIVGLRYFNVYGANEFFKDKTASTVIQFAHQILAQKSPRLFEGSDKILRDFIYIKDVIQANIKACSPKKSGVYNIGTGKPRSFQDIADIVQKALKTDYPTEYFPNPFKGYQMHTQANISDSNTYLGYQPRWSLEEGIYDYIEEIKRVYNEEVKN